jgi:GT2 family glycosyltransferase
MTSLTREPASLSYRETSAGLPSASVIVVGYNSREYLDRCFLSLLRVEYPGKFDILFVDNRSEDNSADYVRLAYPTVRVVDANENLGYAGGNNLGARRSSGDVLVFLNPDTEVEPGWLAALVSPMVADSGVGLTTSRILMMHDRGRINTCGNEVSLAGITWCRGAGQPAQDFDLDADVSAVSGCSFAIRRSLYTDLEGFDERFFMYLEDTDLSWRARALGYRCRYVASSIVYHDYSLSLSPRKVELLERNRYRMLGKHLSLRSVLALTPALLSTEVLTWGYSTLRGPRHLLAKARATGWAVTQVGPVVRKRWRPSEVAILRAHDPSPPVVDGIGGAPSRIAQRALGAFARRTAEISLRFLPDPDQTDSPAFPSAKVIPEDAVVSQAGAPDFDSSADSAGEPS